MLYKHVQKAHAQADTQDTLAVIGHDHETSMLLASSYGIHNMLQQLQLLGLLPC